MSVRLFQAVLCSEVILSLSFAAWDTKMNGSGGLESVHSGCAVRLCPNHSVHAYEPRSGWT